jgi:hypothetical protein
MALIAAAPVSFICLLLVWWIFESRLPCLDITGFSIIAGMIIFLVALVAANVMYFLGPLSEILFRPNNKNAFRKHLYALGRGFSLLLIYSPALGNLFTAVFGSGFTECR